MLTTEATITAGAVKRRGSNSDYRGLSLAPGEPHVVREELAKSSGIGTPRSLCFVAQLSDLHMVDAQSPARLEMMHGVLDLHDRTMVPMQRPQELLTGHAADALVRAINRAQVSPLTGAKLAGVVTTGDNVDSMQANEVSAYLATFSGGTVRTNSGGPSYEGVQNGRYPWAWAPEAGAHVWNVRYGFPEVPGLISAALGDFTAEGLKVPWLTCYGNHDALSAGRAPVSNVWAEIATGSRKPVAAPAEPFGDVMSTLDHLYIGESIDVTPDAQRRPLARDEFVAAHFEDGGLPRGHGFTEENIEKGTAYFAHDVGELRLLVLDTTNPAGMYEGSLDVTQFEWLQHQLESTSRENKLTVVVSHHPRETMVNPRTVSGESRRVLGDEVDGLLQQFPLVIAWISGHLHRHRIVPRISSNGGYWEITTASITDWPSQARLIEVLDNADGTLSIVTTCIDHDAPVAPRGLEHLASWHRELALNDPESVQGKRAVGEAHDRNAVLHVRDPRRS